MNYTFSGAGTIPGGEYEKVRVSGSAKLAGDVRCGSFSASGALGGSGSIVCSGAMHTSGSASIDGSVSAAELKASGAFKCRGLSGKELRISGSVRVDGDMEADFLLVAGAVNCSGLISADDVEIQINGNCHAQSIGGGNIRILPGDGVGNGLRLFGLKKAGGWSMSVAESIEGDDIYLENVSCPMVTGRRVVIGPGCSIDNVQYGETVELSPEARVGQYAQV